MIREAQLEDYAALRRCFIELQSYEQEIESNRADAQSIANDAIAEIYLNCEQYQGKIFVAEIDHQVVGFICVLGKYNSERLIEREKFYAFITDLVVLNEYRQQGIGQGLLAAAMEYAKSCNASMIKLGVLAANSDALRLYRNNGFVDVEVLLEKKL